MHILGDIPRSFLKALRAKIYLAVDLHFTSSVLIDIMLALAPEWDCQIFAGNYDTKFNDACIGITRTERLKYFFPVCFIYVCLSNHTLRLCYSHKAKGRVNYLQSDVYHCNTQKETCPASGPFGDYWYLCVHILDVGLCAHAISFRYKGPVNIEYKVLLKNKVLYERLRLPVLSCLCTLWKQKQKTDLTTQSTVA